MRVFRSLILVALCGSCLEPYLPPVTSDSQTILVVDGYIAADGTANVRLSRSVPLSSYSYAPSEKGAEVSIESSSGQVFDLTEGDSATYATSELKVHLEDKFTLHIRTKDGEEYRSDNVMIYPTPPIDDVYFTTTATGSDIEINVNANDPNPNATGFYLWDCIETYQYHAPLFSGWKRVNGNIEERAPNELVYMCWRDVTKPSVMLSTRYLSNNTISAHRVALVPKGSEKLSIKYSVLVKQRAISEDEYNFRTQLQNSTELQGSLFSVIPGAIVSNVHSLTDPNRYVLGYFRGQDVKEKRLFIDFDELPSDFKILPPIVGDCQPLTTCPIPTPPSYFDCLPVELLGPNALIVTANTNSRGAIVSFNYVVQSCGDCRYFGGTTTKPSFWP